MARNNRSLIASNPSTEPVSRVNSSALIEKRRRQIVDGATIALAQHGFGKTGVKQIAECANVSIGLVYEYVRTKEDILFLVFEHWTNVWVSALRDMPNNGANAIERLRAGIGCLVDLAERHRHVTHLFYREAGSLTPEAREWSKMGERQVVDIFCEILREGVKEGYIRKDVNLTVLASNVLLLTHGWALKGYLLHDECSADEYARWLLNSVVRSCLTDDGLAVLERATRR